MFTKKTKLPDIDLAAGWSPELIFALMKHPSERGLGIPSKDYEIAIDGFVLDSNNFETERRAYSHLVLVVCDNLAPVSIPVVVNFVLEDDGSPRFNARPEYSEISVASGTGRVYGRAILNGRYIHKDNSEICLPVFEWDLFLLKNEWGIVREALQLSGRSNSLRIGVRIGFPNSVTAETVANDSMNSRLLIHRIWVSSTTVISAGGLQENGAFLSDMG